MSMRKNIETMVSTNFRAPKELFERLDEIAAGMYISRNSAMIQAMAAWVNQKETEKKLTSKEEIAKMIANSPELLKALSDAK